jgi:O-succinylbenzoic acid--CoA ligase
MAESISMVAVRVVRCDGTPGSVAELAEALAEALAGGPAVLPVEGPTDPGGGADTTRADSSGSASVSAPDGSALVIETSGSTGGAKRVVLGAGALRASATATLRRLGGPGRWLLPLPAHHVAGAQVVVRGLLAGHPPSVLDNRHGFRPDRFAAAATELFQASGTRYYTSLVPTQLHRVLLEGGAALAAARGFHAVLVGGAATPPALLVEARTGGIAVVTTYGMSETAGGCVYDGVPLDGVRVRLDGDGRIELGGPVLASGYLDQPELTAESFVDGWFRTSDLGRWAPDGTLRVLGRADDVITTGGESVHPAAVERVLAAQPGVRAACVVSVPDPEWGQLVAAAVVCGPGAGPAPDTGSWAEAVRAELGAPSVPRLVRVLDELPVRGIGKPDRVEVARMLAATRQAG